MRLKTIFIKKLKGDEQGSILLLSLFITTIFVVFTTSYLGLVSVEAKLTEKAHRSALALHLAESGIEEAIWEFNFGGADFDADGGWTGTDPVVKTSTLTASDGTSLGEYMVSVSDPTGDSPVIEGVGSAYYQTTTSAEQRTVDVTFAKFESGPFTMAAFVDTSMDMASNACTDSFDSGDGPYSTNPGSPNYDSNGDIGTNPTDSGAVTLASNVSVSGDAYVGVGGNAADVIDADQEDAISGNQDALEEAVEIESITGPAGLTDNGSVTYDDRRRTTHTISSSGQYADLTVGGNSTLSLSGNIQLYITGTFSMTSNSDLVIEEGSEVEIYVDGAMVMDSNTTVNNNTMDPSKLKIYGTDNMVDNGATAGIRFHSNADIYATVQAKNSTVDMSSNVEIFGGVIADKVVMASNTCIHYDEALGSGGVSDSGTTGEVVLWQEK